MRAMFSYLDPTGARGQALPEVQESVLGQAKDQETEERTVVEMAKRKPKVIEEGTINLGTEEEKDLYDHVVVDDGGLEREFACRPGTILEVDPIRGDHNIVFSGSVWD